ncbi:hypothetical protein AB0F11_18510 [Streptomyces sp. NPDC032472]|uniref:hypothetical protein n=1 Tax=Streptomyces sp. NPDC032472 TaxID=3155018 RepID=UPI0033CD202F
MPSSLSSHWLRGVAVNPGAPADVLLRLLDPAAGEARMVLCQDRDLPAEVVDAIVAHPDRKVRRVFARNPHVDPARLRPLVHDPSAIVRAWLASGPRPAPRKVRPLPDDMVEALLTEQDEAGHDGMLTASEIAGELLSSRQIAPSFSRRWHAHEHPALRKLAPGWSWQALGPEQRAALLADPDPAVREAAHRQNRTLDPAAMEADLPEQDCHHRAVLLNNYAVSPAVVEACFADGRNLYGLAYNRHTPADAVARLARNPDPEVRARVAARADLDAALLAELAEDPHEAVRLRARVQPLPRTWAQCGAVDAVLSAGDDCTCPIFEPYEATDDWYAACARSEEVVLRKVAAGYPRLPVDLVRLLAEDPVPAVRHRLAVHHPLAPPELLLDAFLARPGQRPYLLTLPALPRTGLARLLDHADADVRALAAADPTLPEPPVRLLADPEEQVRRAAAANPVFPAEALDALLDDPRTAEGAAANPHLPPARLHRLLDLSGLPGGSRPPSGPGSS